MNGAESDLYKWLGPVGRNRLFPPPPDIPQPDVNLRPGIEFQAPGQEKNPFAQPGPPDIFKALAPSAQSLAPEPAPPPPSIYDKLSQVYSERPLLSDEHPSKMRRLFSSLAGGLTGMAYGPQTGEQTAEGMMMSPYREKLMKWGDKLAPLIGEQEQEANRAKAAMDAAKTQAEYERANAEYQRAIYMSNRLAAESGIKGQELAETHRHNVATENKPGNITPDFESHYEPTSGDVITTNKRTGEISVHKGVGTPRPEKPIETPEEKFNWEAKLIRLREGLIAGRERAAREGKGTKVGIDDVNKATEDAVRAVIIGNPRWAKFAKNGKVTGMEHGADQYGRETTIPLDLSKPGMQQDYDAFLEAVHEQAQDILDQHYGTAPPGKLEEDSSPRSQSHGKFSSSKVVE